MINRSRTEVFDITKVLALILIVHFIYNNFWRDQTIIIIKESPNFSLLDPHNETANEIQDTYDQLIDIKDFHFMINPQPCQGYSGLLLLIIISSHPDNYNNRKVIRETWGRTEDTTKVLFLLGETENEETLKRITYEDQIHNDIVQGNFIDSYRNLTYKHVMGLKWVAHHCNIAKYILKTDDDVLINIQQLRWFLVRELSPWGAINFIGCHIWKRGPVRRSPDSKWKVSWQEYAGHYYPNYCSGCSVLYSQDVVMKLLQTAQKTPYFWIDDVYVTGIIAEKSGIKLTPLSELVLFAGKAKTDLESGRTNQDKYIIGPADLTVVEMMKMWKAFFE